MAIFDYTGRNATGELVKGRQEADSSDSLAGQLMLVNVVPLSIKEVTLTVDYFEQLKRSLGIGAPKLVDIILFSRQMYALAKSGVPIIKGLALIAGSTRNEIFAEVLRDVVDDLESGQSLSAGLSHHVGTFSPLYINMIRVGEETGNLDEAFLRLYHYLDTDKKTLEKVKSALFYPASVLIAIVLAIFFLMAKVIPKFAMVFEKFDLELPFQTRILISASNFVADYWWLIFILVVGAIVAARRYVSTPAGRYNWHRKKLRIPRIGDILLRAMLSRFARAFSMSYGAGVPILQVLTTTAKAVDNAYMEEKVKAVRNEVERGESLTRAVKSSALFTPLVIQMIEVGEETGRLDEMMQEVAEFYESEVAYDVDNLSKIIEPLLTVVMGFMVLILALGIFLPMWDLVKITQR